MSTMVNAVVTNCGHSFCKHCIVMHIQQAEGGKAFCPLCKASITKRSLIPNSKISDLATAVKIFTKHVHEACGLEKGNYQKFHHFH